MKSRESDAVLQRVDSKSCPWWVRGLEIRAKEEVRDGRAIICVATDGKQRLGEV